MRKVALTLALALLLALTLLASRRVLCPIDDSDTYQTGKTQVEETTGKLMYQYKCSAYGHLIWVIQD